MKLVETCPQRSAHPLGLKDRILIAAGLGGWGAGKGLCSSPCPEAPNQGEGSQGELQVSMDSSICPELPSQTFHSREGVGPLFLTAATSHF